MHALSTDPLDGFTASLGSAKDTLLAVLDAGRQRVPDVDLTAAPQAALDASRTAIESARDSIPAGWPGHVSRRRSSRWPWVALILIGTTLLTFALLAPSVRRWTAGVKPGGELAESAGGETTDGAGPAIQPVDPGIAPEDTDAG